MRGKGDENNMKSDHTSNRLNGTKTVEERRQMRQRNKVKKESDGGKQNGTNGENRMTGDTSSDKQFMELLTRNEDELLNFVAQVNKVYQEKLKRNAPFMTFVFCGMQSAGKSTIMERFMNAVLNIVQEGTGTRCPLDTTCIHDDSCNQPKCDLSGNELAEGMAGEHLSVKDVFDRITNHNKRLGEEDRFSTEPLRLVYRAKNVQNMRFVDTPGIIANRSTGKDNREDITAILRSEMRKPNTKLCVLLEPKEFATNPIIEFCDSTLGERKKWISDATFLMTKFDKQLEDSRTASKANNFFKEFHSNQCFPHLVITPTLPKEDIPAAELFKARLELLNSANGREKDRFDAWLEGHDQFRQQNNGGEEEILSDDVRRKIGFASAKKVMRQIMLEDTAKRLPEVLASLREELARCHDEEKILLEKEKFNDPANLKLVVSDALWHVERRIRSYLDGDLEASIKFPGLLQTLEEEICEEEESDWSRKELNHHTHAENNWRDSIANFEGEYPVWVQPQEKFLGGKQVQRAIEYFKAVMIEELPDPFELKDTAKNATGYLVGGIQRENWERAMVQVTTTCVKKVSHPGINFLIKHVGCIFRRLFSVALDDVKQGEQCSAKFKLLPAAVEKFLIAEFDVWLWDLLQCAADRTHCGLEPMYSTVNPNLPTFRTNRMDGLDREDLYVKRPDGKFERLLSKRETAEGSLMQEAKARLNAFASSSAEMAKEFLKTESLSRATRKSFFLPDERTSMTTEEETMKILTVSFEYIVALTEFILVILKFQINHYLFVKFKEELSRAFNTKLLNEADWNKLVEPNPGVKVRLLELKEQIASLTDSLQEVTRMQRFM